MRLTFMITPLYSIVALSEIDLAPVLAPPLAGGAAGIRA